MSNSRKRIVTHSSETHFHSLIELLPARIFAKDRSGRYIFANSAFAKTTSAVSVTDLVGKKPSDVLDPERAVRAEEEDLFLMSTGKPILDRENLDEIGTNEPRWSLVSKVPVKNQSGEVEGIVGVAYDIHERKRSEETLSKLSQQLGERNQQLENNLELARQIHQSLSSPQLAPSRPSDSLRIETALRQSSTLGGDLLRIERKDNGDCLVMLCDVMGHGVQAALISALLSGLIDRVLEETQDPGLLLANLNGRFLGALGGRAEFTYATVICAYYRAEASSITWASAGHPFPLRFDALRGAVVPIDSGPLQGQGAIGVHETFDYKSDTFQLGAGDRVLFYSDGIVEARDGRGGELGEPWLAERFEGMCLRPEGPSIGELYSQLERSSPAFPEDDASAAILSLND